MEIKALLDVDVVAVESEDRLAVLLDVTAPEATGSARAPSTLVVVLDRSGSMAGPPLDAAKGALESLVGRLAPTDRFGVVVYDDETQVVVPAEPLTDKDAVRAAIQGIRPGGSTNLSAGYLRGVQEARRAAGDGRSTLVLLSDGHANRGIRDHDRLAEAARTAHAHGVTTSTIGLGLGYDEALLAAMARGGTGDHRFAVSADEGAEALAAEVDGLLEQVAQAGTLTIRPSSDVATVTLHNDLPATGLEDAVMVELGDFCAGETRKVLVSFDVPAMAGLGLSEVARLELRWTDTATLASQLVTLPIHVNVVPGDQAAGRVPDPAVRTELAFQEAQKAKGEAARALRAGDHAGADAAWAAASAALVDVQASSGDAAAELDAERALLDELRAQSAALPALASKRAEADRHHKTRRRGRER